MNKCAAFHLYQPDRVPFRGILELIERWHSFCCDWVEEGREWDAFNEGKWGSVYNEQWDYYNLFEEYYRNDENRCNKRGTTTSSLSNICIFLSLSFFIFSLFCFGFRLTGCDYLNWLGGWMSYSSLAFEEGWKEAAERHHLHHSRVNNLEVKKEENEMEKFFRQLILIITINRLDKHRNHR